jgi:hypothetical protein
MIGVRDLHLLYFKAITRFSGKNEKDRRNVGQEVFIYFVFHPNGCFVA